MEKYLQIFNALPFPCLLLKPIGGQFFIWDANKECMNATAKRKEELIEMIIPDVFPENPELLGTNWKEIHYSLNKALTTGEPDCIETLRYDILNYETDEFDENYWQVENIPIKDEKSGKIIYIFNIVRDITAEVLERKKNHYLRKLLYKKISAFRIGNYFIKNIEGHGKNKAATSKGCNN